MAIWTFMPQETLDEIIGADVQVAQVSPLATLVEDASTTELIRTFRLRYTIVTSEDATAMAAFFTARRGSFEPFEFINPNDMRVYQVRFDSAMQLEFFQPRYFRQGQDVMLTVVAG